MTTAEAPRPVYRPRGRIRDLWAFRGREVLVAGPAGTGKSRGALEKLDNCARLYPRMRGLIARKLRTTLTQTALVTFNEKVLNEGDAERWFHHGDQEYRYPNGSVIAVSGLDDPERVKSSDYDLVYVQEATELEEDDWAMLLRGLRNNVMPYQQIMADCNPAGPDHWLKRRCTTGACTLLESQHTDNPALWDAGRSDWTPFGLEYMNTLDSLTGYLKRRLRFGEWVAAEGMYFTEFSQELHTCEPFDVPAHWPRWTGIDWGWAAPWVVLWFARDPETKRIYVYREFSRPGIRDDMQAKYIARASQGERVLWNVADPSMFNPRSESNRPAIATVYAQNGVPLVPALNNRLAGWQRVRRALAGKEPELQLMRGRCPILIARIPEQVCDPLDPEDLADKIRTKKTPDDEVDALRYGLMHEGQPRKPNTEYGWSQVK